MCLTLDVRTWFCQTAESSSLLPLGERRLSSPVLHLLLSFPGTWLRRTWRTPPSGWERASVPLCVPCWASLCTEHFSNSGDGTAAHDSLQLPLVTLPLPFLPERLKTWLIPPGHVLYSHTTQRKCWGKPFYMHWRNSVLVILCGKRWILKFQRRFSNVGIWMSPADEIIFLRSVIFHVDGQRGQRQPCRETPQRDLNLFSS